MDVFENEEHIRRAAKIEDVFFENGLKGMIGPFVTEKTGKPFAQHASHIVTHTERSLN